MHIKSFIFLKPFENLEKCKVLLNDFKIPAVFPAIGFILSKNEY